MTAHSYKLLIATTVLASSTSALAKINYTSADGRPMCCDKVGPSGYSASGCTANNNTSSNPPPSHPAPCAMRVAVKDDIKEAHGSVKRSLDLLDFNAAGAKNTTASPDDNPAKAQ